MSYPNYGGGYPQQPGYPAAPGGFQGAPGYPAGGGYPPAPGGGMPTPESASAAAYGGAPGGLPYAPQPGAPSGPGNIGFNTGPPMPSGPPMPGMPPGPGYPQAPPAAMPGGPPQQPGYPAQPSYPQAPQGPGYNPAPPGGYGAPPYGSPQGGAPPHQQSYGAPPAGGYGAPPAGGHNPPQAASYAPPAGGYGAPSAAGGYGAPQTGGYGAPPTASQPYGGYGTGQSGAGGHGGAHPTVKDEGTLKPYKNFSAEADAQVLRKAMKGFGTDEKTIIDVLGNRSNDQRMNLKVMYKTCFGRDLVSDLKSELGGRFEDAVVALMMTPAEFDAYELRNAMQGIGTNEATLIEILCTRSNAEIKALSQAYKTMYRGDLEKAIMGETSGHFKKLMISMCAGGRQEHQALDYNKANADAQKLYQAGVKRWGTDENTFNMVLASQSFQQCRAVFEAYIKIAGHDIETAVKREMSGDLETGLVTIVRVIRNKHEYFADRLYQSMKGLGTNDRALIRVVVSRCEVDMKQIKMEFQRKYGKGLESFIRDDISGDYRKLLLALVSDHY